MITITRKLPVLSFSDKQEQAAYERHYLTCDLCARHLVHIESDDDSLDVRYGEWHDDAAACDADALCANDAWCAAINGALAEAANCSSEWLECYVDCSYEEFTETLSEGSLELIAGLLGIGTTTEITDLMALSQAARDYIKVRALWAVANMAGVRCSEGFIWAAADSGDYTPEALDDMWAINSFANADYYIPYDDALLIKDGANTTTAA